MKLHRRLEALERGLLTEPTILTMPDGSIVTMAGHGDYLLPLLGVAFDGENVSPRQAAHLDLIRRSTDANEPDGAHLVDLIRCLLLSPTEEGI